MTERTSARMRTVRRLMAHEPTDRRADTQRRLLEAGRSVIALKGIGRSSIGQICQEAGFTRGAFYSNFTDLDHFVEQLARSVWAETLEHVTQVLATEIIPASWALRDGEVLDRVRHLSDALLLAVPRDREFHLLWTELSTFAIRHPEESVRLREAILAQRGEIGDYIDDVLEALGLSPAVPATDIVDLVLGIGFRSTRNRLLGDATSDAEELVDRLLPLLLPALSSPSPED